jgi:hypothetical protein
MGGLMPIRLHIHKLCSRQVTRSHTLHGNHAIARLTRPNHPFPHRLNAHSLTEKQRRKTSGAVIETAENHSEVAVKTERIDPTNDKAWPGRRILDRFPEQVTFIPFNKKDPDAAAARRDTIASQAIADPQSACIGTYTEHKIGRDVSGTAVAAAIVRRGVEPDRPMLDLDQLIAEAGQEVIQQLGVVGAVDAEASAIRIGLEYALTLEPHIDHVAIFTSNIKAAERLLDPSAHSGQGDSLAIAEGLGPWLSVGPQRRVSFVHSPIKFKHGLQESARTRRLRYPLVGPFTRQDRPSHSIDHLRSAATEYALGVWSGMFSFPSYRGHNFLILNDGMFGPPVKPSHLKKGPWMRAFGDNPQLFARGCRATLCHAPIGEYRLRFFPSEDTNCSHCHSQMVQTRSHILLSCRALDHRPEECDHLDGFAEFLRRNPMAFAFPPNQEPLPPRRRVGGRRGGSPSAPDRHGFHFGSAPF